MLQTPFDTLMDSIHGTIRRAVGHLTLHRSPGSHCIRQLLQHFDSVVPVDARIRDADSLLPTLLGPPPFAGGGF